MSLESDDAASECHTLMVNARWEWGQGRNLAHDRQWYFAARRDHAGQLEAVDAIDALLDWLRAA